MEKIKFKKNQKKLLGCLADQAIAPNQFIKIDSRFFSSTKSKDFNELEAAGLIIQNHSYRVSRYSKSYALTELGFDIAQQFKGLLWPKFTYSKAEIFTTEEAYLHAAAYPEQDSVDYFNDKLNKIDDNSVICARRKGRTKRGYSTITGLSDSIITKLNIVDSNGEVQWCATSDIGACQAMAIYHYGRLSGQVDPAESAHFAELINSNSFYEGTVGRKNKKDLWTALNSWAKRCKNYQVLKLLKTHLPSHYQWLKSELDMTPRFFMNIANALEATIRNSVIAEAHKRSIPVLDKQDSFVYPKSYKNEIIEIIHQSINNHTGIRGCVKTKFFVPGSNTIKTIKSISHKVSIVKDVNETKIHKDSIQTQFPTPHLVVRKFLSNEEVKPSIDLTKPVIPEKQPDKPPKPPPKTLLDLIDDDELEKAFEKQRPVRPF